MFTRLLVACGLVAGLLGPAGRATAAFNPLITLNETGQGSLLFPGAAPVPTAGALIADPGPGGLAAALTYNLLGPPGLVAGDLIVLDPDNVTVSDILRFNPAGSGGNPGYPASVVVYSLPGGGDLADTGFPTARYTNLARVLEVNGVAEYTPDAGQPGFVPGFSVTYRLISDANAVPAPAGLILAGLGLPALGLVRRVRRVA